MLHKTALLVFILLAPLLAPSRTIYARNPFAPREPMVANPNMAFPRVSSLPGPPLSPASYAPNSLISQLAHSSNGIVRLPPGDYSIPVRFY